MKRIFSTITAAALCLLMLLPGTGVSIANSATPDEEKIVAPRPATSDSAGAAVDDEKIVTPRPGAPGGAGTVIIVPSPVSPPQGSGGATAPSPTRETPDSGKAVIVPLPFDNKAPAELPAVPVPPYKTSPVELPAVPVPPRNPDGTTVLTPAPTSEASSPERIVIVPLPSGTSPADNESPKPESSVGVEPGKQPSPLDFMVKPTPLSPVAPDKTQPALKAEKSTPPDKAPPPAPKAQPPLAAEQSKPKSGAPLRIPPGAAEKGDLSFLEGCWRGTRPEYYSKRTITERFCFDKNGNGKRHIQDPRYAGECFGASKGSFDGQGRLIVTSEQGYCSKGAIWGQAYMICEGEGNSTPCSWHFKDAGGASQSYKIPFVRE